MTRLPCVLAILLLVACAESNTPPDGGVDGGTMGSDAGADAGEDAGGGCATAMEGMACPTAAAICGGPCTDACSFCNILRCTMGVWERLEAPPAPCYECGPDQQCVAFEEYCVHSFSDVGGEPDIFSCEDMPAACTSDATCMCLETALTFDMCLEPNPGELEIQYFGG